MRLIYKLTKAVEFSKDFALRDQIRRAAISVMSNIAEGFDAGYDNEFIRFLGYSFRSISEIQSQLYTASDESYITETEFREAYDQCADVRKQIRGLVKYLASNTRSGRTVRDQSAPYLSEQTDLFSKLELPSQFTVD